MSELREINVQVERLATGETVIDGLRPGWVKCSYSLVEDVRRHSRQGSFYPYRIETILTECPDEDWVSMAVEEML